MSTIIATHVGVDRVEPHGKRIAEACPRCGFVRTVRVAGTGKLCSDCQLVEPDFGQRR
jgi:hypothetical protein